jgi:hypothetical protein
MRVAVGPLPEPRIDPVFEEYKLAARPIGHPLAALGGPAGLGVSIVLASIRRLGGEDVVFRTLSDDIPLWAPSCLGTKRSNTSPTVQRFRQLVKRMRDGFRHAEID